jgi:hypothetical protein
MIDKKGSLKIKSKKKETRRKKTNKDFGNNFTT